MFHTLSGIVKDKQHMLVWCSGS